MEGTFVVMNKSRLGGLRYKVQKSVTTAALIPDCHLRWTSVIHIARSADNLDSSTYQPRRGALSVRGKGTVAHEINDMAMARLEELPAIHPYATGLEKGRTKRQRLANGTGRT